MFLFILVVSEMNAYLAYHFFCCPDPVPTLQQFHHKLACQLNKNKYIIEEDVNEQQEVCAIHQLMRAPPHAMKFVQGWVCTAKLQAPIPELSVHHRKMW